MEEIIRLAHGNGGKLTQQLVRDVLFPCFNNQFLASLDDSAVIKIDDVKIAFTTDSYVVKPLFFPGGDIGKLAASGTINDLAVMGAKPVFISCALIIEEGLSISDLKKIIFSIQNEAEKVGVNVVAGDTKVVEKDSADGIFINTSGIGIISPQVNLGIERIKAGDKIIVNGTIGDHSVAILSQREELGFETSLESDCAPIYDLISKLKDNWSSIKFMRDPTRGGVAGVLNEIAQDQSFGIELWEKSIPFQEETLTVCELLGLDPLYLANEGKVILFVDAERAEDILTIFKNHPLGKESNIIGEVVAEPKGKVYLLTTIGTRRVIDTLVEDQLPRIC